MIQLFLCGGTIDKTYFPDREVFDFSETHIHQMMDQARIFGLELEITELLQKDSMEMTNEDRKIILENCIASEAKRILIMHGTSTMTETAEYIQKNMPEDKTIVFVGSLLPYELAKSDALFNFGAAVSAVQILPAGSYITMNGKIWRAGEVTKDVKNAVFVKKTKALLSQ
jgi:L-asparaginase